MDTSIAILMSLTTLLAAATAWAAFRRQQQDVQDQGTVYRRNRALLDETLAERRAVIARKKELKKELKPAYGKAEALQQRLRKRPNDTLLSQQLDALRAQINRAENELLEQEKEERRIALLLSELEAEVQHSYTEMQVRTAQTKAEKALQEAEKALKQSPHGGWNRVYEKAELKVRRREEQAVAELDVTNTESVELQKVVEHLIKIRARLISGYDSIKGLMATSDPSLDAAYQRLLDQMQVAEEIAENSIKAENELEIKIADFANNSWITDDSLEGLELTPEEASVRDAHSKSTAVALELALRAHRRKNLAVRYALFRVDDVVRRLRVLKMLCSTHPELRGQVVIELRNVVADLGDWLVATIRGESAEKISDVRDADISSRIEALNSRVLLAYIELIKSGSNKLRLASFKSEAEAIHATLSKEMPFCTSQCDDWKELAKQAEQEKKEVLFWVASQRVAAWSDYISTNRQTMEVLELAIGI